MSYDVDYYLKLLEARMQFIGDVKRYMKTEEQYKLLLVEGDTDDCFLKSVKKDSIVCLPVIQAFGNKEERQNERDNNKEVIVNVVYRMERFPQTVSVPSMKEWDVYGMVDLDFDSDEDINANNVFVTDTHDLETLLISTDSELISKLDGCVITDEEVRKALFLAYQMSFLRRALYGKLDCKCLGENNVDYSNIFDGLFLNFDKAVRYINKSEKNGLNSKKITTLLAELRNNKIVKKKIDNGLKWNQMFENFDISNIEDFWKIVNGHDILTAFRYINESAYYAFSDSKGYLVNREFEKALIAKYDYLNFTKTELYKEMLTQKIIKEIS